MNKVVIDDAKITDLAQLHRYLAIALQLPSWYGGNLDALWDCLTGEISLPLQLSWINYQPHDHVLGEDVEPLLALFREAEAELEGFYFELVTNEESTIMKPFEAILFDLDNTLLDRTGTFRKLASFIIERYLPGSPDHEQLLNRFMELDQDGYKDKHELFNEVAAEFPWKDAEHTPTGADLFRLYETDYVKNATLMEGAEEIIAYAKRKYRVALITNGRTTIQNEKLDLLHIRDWFEEIIISDSFGIHKPDPAIFEHTVSLMGLEPESCLYVGDHPVNDVQGAAAAGIKTAWVKVNLTWPEQQSPLPDYTLDNITQLTEII